MSKYEVTYWGRIQLSTVVEANSEDEAIGVADWHNATIDYFDCEEDEIRKVED